MANFHVDTSGNLWLGVTSETFTTSAPFYVQSDGTVKATSGTIGGISINSSNIQANYSSGSSGFRIQSSGTAEFNGPILTFGKVVGSPSSTNSIEIGDAKLYNADISSTSSLVSTKSFIVTPDGDEDNPSLAIDGQYGTLGFFVDVPLSGISRMQITNGDNNVASWSTANSDFTVNDKLVLGGSIQVGGSTGSNNQYIGKNSSGTLGFHNLPSGNDHPDSDHSFASTGHDHDSDYYSSSAGSFLASSLSSHTSQAHSLSILSNTNSDDSGGLFVTSVSGLGIRRTNRAGTTMYSQTIYPKSTETYALGGSGNKWTIVHSQFGVSTSDERLKENIEDLTLGLDFINSLQPKKYNWTTETITTDDGEELVKRGDIANIDMFGFMAQDILALDTLDDSVNYGIARYVSEQDSYEISHENFIAPLVKAVQELSTQVSDLTARIEALEG